jgi:tetratricopeptide (TPR) repeat protein
MIGTVVFLILVLAIVRVALAQPGVVSVVTYDETGTRLEIGTGFVLGPGGDLIVRRSQLLRASSAEARLSDTAVWPIRYAGGEDLDADLLRVRAAAPVGPLESLLIAEEENTGEMLKLAEPLAPGAVLVNKRGQATAIGLGGRHAVPIQRALSLDRAGTRTLAEWRGAFSANRIAAEKPYRDALVHLRDERHESALPDLEFATRKDPQFAEAWFQLGMTLGKLGHAEEKIQAYERAVELRSDYVEARYNLALSLLLGGYREAAEAQVVLIKPWNPELAEKLRDIVYMIKVDPFERKRLVQ